MISPLISDRDLLEAIRFDGESAAFLKACVERTMIAEARLKRVKALEMKRHEHLPMAAQEREAFASKAYLAAAEDHANANAALEEMKAKRAHVRLRLDIWKTLETSHRVISKYP